MQKSFKIFLPILLFVLTNCDNVERSSPVEKRVMSTLSFSKDEEFLIDLPFEFNVGINFTVQPYRRNDTDFILMGDIRESRLVEVDITNKTFSRTIFLPRVKSGSYPLFVHHYLNEDTIIVFRSISNEYSRTADTILHSIDINGNYNGAYKLIGSPYRLEGMPRDTIQASFFHHFLPMEVAENRFYVDPVPLWDTRKKESKDDKGVAQIGYFDFRDNDSIVYGEIPYYLKSPKDVVYADEQLWTNFHAVSKNKIIASHANQVGLRLIDVESGNFIESTQEGSLLPAPRPLDSMVEKTPTKNINSTLFDKIIFDSDKEIAYRFGTFPSNIDLLPGDLQAFRDSNVWVGAYDKKLNLLGQAMKPQWFNVHPKPYYFNGKFICVEPTDNLKRFKLQYVSIDIKKLTSEDYDSLASVIQNVKPRQTKENISSMFKKLDLPENSVILTVSDRSCPYCVNYSIQYFLSHLKKMEEQGVYLVISERNASDDVKNTQSPNIIIDQKRSLEKLLKQSVDNPALMLWDGDKVTRTMVMPPSEVKHLDSKLKFFMDLVR